MFPGFSYVSSLIIFIIFASLLNPSFPARTLHDKFKPDSLVTAILPIKSTNYTWSGIERFLDAGKGTSLDGMSKLKKYFHRFGYLPQPAGMISNRPNFTDVFDDEFESALIQYQSKLGLPVTAKLDSTTLSQVMSPRCGRSDAVHMVHTTKHYATLPGNPRWSRSMLTYAISPYKTIDYISQSDIKGAIERAFSTWASVVPLNFIEARDYESADIKIGFYEKDHGDDPFDDMVLAHAIQPENGSLHLNTAQIWAVDFGVEKSWDAFDLESVALHELGHVLGLDHSSLDKSVMYPYIKSRRTRLDLRLDDVIGIQSLYGANPNFDISSLLDSGSGGGLRRNVSKWVYFLRIALILFFSM